MTPCVVEGEFGAHGFMFKCIFLHLFVGVVISLASPNWIILFFVTEKHIVIILVNLLYPIHLHVDFLLLMLCS